MNIDPKEPLTIYVVEDQPVPIAPVVMSMNVKESIEAAYKEPDGRTMVGVKNQEWFIGRQRFAGGKLETLDEFMKRTAFYKDVIVLLSVYPDTKVVKALECFIRSESFLVDSEENKKQFKRMAKESVEACIADGTIQFETVEAD